MTTSITMLENGDLQFSSSDYNFTDYREAVEIGKKYYGENAIQELFEGHFCNSDYAIVPERFYSELGALTSAPIISDYDFWLVDESDGEEAIKERDEYMKTMKIWWYPEYMVYNCFEVLLRTGKVVFTLAND